MVIYPSNGRLLTLWTALGLVSWSDTENGEEALELIKLLRLTLLPTDFLLLLTVSEYYDDDDSVFLRLI